MYQMYGLYLFNISAVRKKKKKELENESINSDDDFQENTQNTPLSRLGSKTAFSKAGTPAKRMSRRKVIDGE